MVFSELRRCLKSLVEEWFSDNETNSITNILSYCTRKPLLLRRRSTHVKYTTLCLLVGNTVKVNSFVHLVWCENQVELSRCLLHVCNKALSWFKCLRKTRPNWSAINSNFHGLVLQHFKEAMLRNERCSVNHTVISGADCLCKQMSSKGTRIGGTNNNFMWTRKNVSSTVKLTARSTGRVLSATAHFFMDYERVDFELQPTA